MSNRKNHRRNDKFTGPTRGWHRFKSFPRGMDIWGWAETPGTVRFLKHQRVKRMRVTVDIELDK